MESIKYITPFISVTGQIQPEDMASIAAAGFVTVINNRPDAEAEEQPSSVQMAEAAGIAGLQYHYLPIISGQLTDENVSDFAQLLTGVKGPVLAFCRSGTRSCSLWALSEAHRLTPLAVLVAAKNAGYDLSGLLPRLEQRWAE